MKLTEQQLAQIFQNSTQAADDNFNLTDCLGTPNMSHAETIVSDFHSAQAVKLAIHMQPWGEQVAQDIIQTQRHTQNASLSHRLHNFFNALRPKSPVLMPSLAVVFTLTAVVFLSNQPILSVSTQTDVATHDVINSLPFEVDRDRLSKAGFDGDNDGDQLFRANFS